MSHCNVGNLEMIRFISQELSKYLGPVVLQAIFQLCTHCIFPTMTTKTR